MNGSPQATGAARGLTIPEVLVAGLALLMLAAIGLPAITATTCDDLKNVSIHNLEVLNVAHALYAADWNDRQFTLVRDDLGGHGFPLSGACEGYQADVGCHPPVFLGADCDGVTHGFFFGCDGQPGSCDDFYAVAPMIFPSWAPPAVGLSGAFRLPNARGFHEYVNGRFFDPVFYAPKDAPVYEQVELFFDEDCEFVDPGGDFNAFSSSYAHDPLLRRPRQRPLPFGSDPLRGSRHGPDVGPVASLEP